MDRVNGADYIDIGGGRRGFRDEDLQNGIAGTEVTALWLNMTQEEILKVITEAGLVPNEGDWTQLWQALQILGLSSESRRRSWLAVISMTLSSAPGAPSAGDTYLIPTGATGIWSTHIGAIAQWNGSVWSYLVPPDGHGISLPDGRVYERIAGTYVEKLALDAQSGKWGYAIAGGTANALTATLVPAPSSIPDGMTVNILLSATNTAAATLNLNGTGARAIVSRRGNALVQGDLPSGTMATFIALGGNWVYAPLEASSFRRRLNANTTLYVNAATGNDNNPGSAGAPWKTLSKAASYLQTALDLNGFVVTVSVADGTYTDAFQLAGYVPGQTDSTKVQVVGNEANPTACYVNCATVAPFGASNGAAFQVSGFQVAASSILAQSGSGLYASTGGLISYKNIAFNACVYAHVLAELGGYCVASGPNTINGNCSTHLFAKDSGTIAVAGRSTTLSGGPTFNGAFASAESGVIEAADATFTGGASGPRYYANANGVIKTNGGGGNFFPGSLAGSVNAGGQYL